MQNSLGDRAKCVCRYAVLNRYWGIVTVLGLVHERGIHTQGRAVANTQLMRTVKPVSPLNRAKLGKIRHFQTFEV